MTRPAQVPRPRLHRELGFHQLQPFNRWQPFREAPHQLAGPLGPQATPGLLGIGGPEHLITGQISQIATIAAVLQQPAPPTESARHDGMQRRTHGITPASSRSNTSTNTSVIDEHTATYKSAFDGK